MKKNIALLLGMVLGFGFVSCSSDDDEETPNTKGNVDGKVLAEMTVTRYDWKDGKRSSEGTLYQVFKYNEKGDCVSKDDYKSGYRTEVIYDDKGRETEGIIYPLDDLKTVFIRTIYERNDVDTGEVVSEYVYNGYNKLVTKYIREYDHDGKPTKCTNISDVDNYHGTVLTYSYSGNTETRVYSDLNDGSFDRKSIFERDKYGNITKETHITDSYTNIGEYRYDYDSNGRLLKVTGPVCNSVNYGFTEYTYNADATVKKEHCVYKTSSFSEEEYDLEYTYTYRNE